MDDELSQTLKPSTSVRKELNPSQSDHEISSPLDRQASACPAAVNGIAHSAFLAQARISNVLQIKTTVDGLNSGRTYYVSTRSNANAADSKLALFMQLSKQASTTTAGTP